MYTQDIRQLESEFNYLARCEGWYSAEAIILTCLATSTYSILLTESLVPAELLSLHR
jgi:hypothetical protein